VREPFLFLVPVPYLGQTPSTGPLGRLAALPAKALHARHLGTSRSPQPVVQPGLVPPVARLSELQLTRLETGTWVSCHTERAECLSRCVEGVPDTPTTHSAASASAS